jgi:stage II sporulation protein P
MIGLKKRVREMNKRSFKIVSILVLIGVFLTLMMAQGKAEEERKDGYFTVYEESTDKKIFATARVINIGDRYLNDKNDLYEVTKIEGDKCFARFVERVDVQETLAFAEAAAMAKQTIDDYNTLKTSELKKEKVIAIYHTHSDESYIPTDGKSSIPYNGGIFKVGETLKSALERKGITVIQSKTPHDPHDSAAYQRSRRTAVELLKKGPDALIDIHRDGVEAEEYLSEVNGRELAQVQMVVGRQNPQIKTVNNFALQLKAIADKKHPGLVKGIFYGKGGYNQDIYPRTILIEAGTYKNFRDKAETGADILADVIATTLYGADYAKEPTPLGGKTTEVPGEGKKSWGSLVWLIVIAIVGVAAFMLISTGGSKELSAKIKRFMGSEFTNFLGNLNKKKQKVSEIDTENNISSLENDKSDKNCEDR